MRFRTSTVALVTAIALSGCSSGGNVKSADDYSSPPAPHVYHPYFNPWMPYGSAHATWEPPVANRMGTIVKPTDPAVTMTRPDYETAPWAIGAQPSPYGGPTGTF